MLNPTTSIRAHGDSVGYDPTSENPSRTVLLEWTLLTIILHVGLGLRMQHLEERALWFDEAYSLRTIEYSFPEMLNLVRYENSPAGYYLLLKKWGEVFGHTVVSVRALSVVCGLLTIAGMYLFFRALFVDGLGRNASSTLTPRQGRYGALLSASLVALSVWQIRYSWEARCYALGTVLVVFSSWALVRALRPSASCWWWFLFSILTLLFLYSHYFALFSVAAQAVFVLGLLLARTGWRPTALVRQNVFWKTVTAGAIIALGVLPGLPMFLHQERQVQAGFWIEPLTSAWNVLSSCYRLFIDPDGQASKAVCAWTGAGCVLVVVVLTYKVRAAELYLLLAGLLPFFLAAGASLIGLHIFHPRYLTFAHVFLLAGLAVVVVRCRWHLSWVLTASLLVGFMWTDVSYSKRIRVERNSGSRGIVTFLEMFRESGEPVVSATGWSYLPISCYVSSRKDYYVYRQPAPAYILGEYLLSPTEIAGESDLQAFTSSRVWVVNVQRYGADLEKVPVPLHWVQRQVTDFWEPIGGARFQVVRYEVPNDNQKKAGN